MHGPAHDSGTRLPILWTRTAKVCTFYDLGVYGFFLSDCFPMVLLGLLAGLQPFCNEWIHRKLGKLRSEGCSRNAFTWITTYSRAALRFLPGEQFPENFNAQILMCM
jgi:hypothetical protein